MGLLLDHRNRESVATTEQVKEFVEVTARLGEAFGDSRCAVVVSEDVAFGTARMCAALSEGTFVPTNIFRDLDEGTRRDRQQDPRRR
jgi:hypothetical protein